MILSIETEKNQEQNSTSSHDRNSKKLGIKKDIPQGPGWLSRLSIPLRSRSQGCETEPHCLTGCALSGESDSLLLPQPLPPSYVLSLSKINK